MDTKERVIEITTGRYGKGSLEQNITVNSIFGSEYARERFATYFYQYNVIHELGHGIMNFNTKIRPHPVHEEKLVNDFAVAYWKHYGEDGMINNLTLIINYALEHLKCPAEIGVDHITYAKENWNKEDFYNFNDYGWFQFSLVNQALSEIRPLESVLTEMGVEVNNVPRQRTLTFSSLGEDGIAEILSEVADALLEWGVELPDIYLVLSNDPAMHALVFASVRLLELTLPILGIENEMVMVHQSSNR